jgi:hypothetical protein
MEEALIAKLLATPAVTTIASTRIRPTMRTQGDAVPGVVVTTIAGGDIYHHGGLSVIDEALVQVDCWGATFLAAKQLARTIKTALSGANFTQGGVTFNRLFLENERDSAEGENPRLFRTMLEFRVWTIQ